MSIMFRLQQSLGYTTNINYIVLYVTTGITSVSHLKYHWPNVFCGLQTVDSRTRGLMDSWTHGLADSWTLTKAEMLCSSLTCNSYQTR